MEYSVTKNAAYCFSCRHFGIGCESSWTKEGYRNWKKGYKDHSETKKHGEATAAWGRYVWNKAKGETVLSQISTAHAEARQITREWIKFVSRTLRYCSSQEIALREHRSENDNKGNFVGAVDLVLKHSQDLRDLRTKLPLNAHYLSPEPQNELLSCMADMVQSVIIDKVKKAKFWSIIADETKDASKTEQLSICIRYWDTTGDKPCLQEDFITLVPLDRMTAVYIAQVISDQVELFGLSWEHLVGQAYDGASTMSGCIAGVSTLIKEKAPLAIYVHCWAHKLNLALVAASQRREEYLLFLISSSPCMCLFLARCHMLCLVKCSSCFVLKVHPVS